MNNKRDNDNGQGHLDLGDLLNIKSLISVAFALTDGARLTALETAVVDENRTEVSSELVASVRQAIENGTDPLGSAYSHILSPEFRRSSGQTFTPVAAVTGMFQWAESQGEICRIVDPGAGTGRYVIAGLRRNPHARGIAVELDPAVALLLRANACVLGLHDRIEIRIQDFRALELPHIEGRTVFIGNPPYVRHHDIAADWKNWYSDRLKSLGHASSKLAGLHLHFFLKVLDLARPGDLGVFITASEWLDVNYGQSMRDLLTDGLGGRAVYVVAPEVRVFEDALVSACITCFEPGSNSDDIEFKAVDSLEQLALLGKGRCTPKIAAKGESKWSGFIRTTPRTVKADWPELGDFFKVRRGQVTGKNKVWVTKENRFGLPEKFLVPSITDAADIVGATDNRIDDLGSLRRVVDLPASLDGLPSGELGPVKEFLRWARSQEADKGYIAEHRSPWWRVNMQAVAPSIVVTYMGRRPPVFAINAAGARLINVAHGLYPKAPLSEEHLVALVDWLNKNVSKESGRVYAGGLTKFEPSEIMRLRIPNAEFFGG